MAVVRLKVIRPKGDLFNEKQIERAVENALDRAALGAQSDFEKTTETWDHRSKFRISRKPGWREVSTDDEVYAYVNDGTPPHKIRARNGQVLAFPSQSRPKTKPRAIRSNKGYKSKATTFRLEVNHPGTEARKFDEAIAEKWEKKWPSLVDRMLDMETE